MTRVFVLMGSGEFEPWAVDVERRALEGDHVFERWGAMGLRHYEGMGVPAEILPVKTREDAMREDLAARAEAASMTFFSGGKPQHLAEVLDGTPLFAGIRRAIDRGAVYAGCSAGAMVASRSRIQRDARGGTSWVFGLGLVDGVSFGVHWDRVKWIPGLRPFVMTRVPPGAWFVGIDEKTAILGDGEAWEVAGRATVTVRHDRGTTIYRAGDRFSTTAGHPAAG